MPQNANFIQSLKPSNHQFNKQEVNIANKYWSFNFYKLLK